MINKITSQDLFGHVVTLNFNEKGDSHKTLGGGACSILVRAMTVVYIYILFKQLILREQNIITTNSYY